MAIRQILRLPDPLLRRKCKPVAKVSVKIRTLLEDMLESMRAGNGIGLAGPQVGELVRAIVCEVPSADNGTERCALANPEIVDRDGRAISEEGCLSIPGVYAPVGRATWIRVRGLNERGKRVEFEAGGLFARCIQHEIDHLDGILFIDRVEGGEARTVLKQALARYEGGTVAGSGRRRLP